MWLPLLGCILLILIYLNALYFLGHSMDNRKDLQIFTIREYDDPM
jgi:hypothetical protein